MISIQRYGADESDRTPEDTGWDVVAWGCDSVNAIPMVQAQYLHFHAYLLTNQRECRSPRDSQRAPA